MTLALILNIVLAAAVFAALIAHQAWSIVTQHRDRPHVFEVAAHRRRRPRLPRPRPASPQPANVRSEAQPGRAWPAS
jgi:hypothetical protein